MSVEAKPEPSVPPGQFVGGTLIVIGLLTIVATLTASLSKPPAPPTAAHGAILLIALLIVVAGIAMYAVSATSQLIERGREDTAAKVERGREDTALQVEQLAAQIEASNQVLRQLSAAPTVRLHEARQLMGDTVERVVGVAKAEVVREIGGKVDELQERFMDLEADLASFRLWQKRTPSDPLAKVNGHGKAVALRSVPSQPE